MNKKNISEYSYIKADQEEIAWPTGSVFDCCFRRAASILVLKGASLTPLAFSTIIREVLQMPELKRC